MYRRFLTTALIEAAAGERPLRGAAAMANFLLRPSSYPYYRWLNNFPKTYAKGMSPIGMDDLISPLRYDIIARYDFFEYLNRNTDCYNQDFERFLSEVKSMEYYFWFRDVLCFRFYRYLRDNPAELDRAFELRVRKSADLYYSFQTVGFDPRFPITLRQAFKILPSTSGILSRGPIFAGDGCHRMALLRLAGQNCLYPNQYRIKKTLFFKPLDNTDIFLKHLPMSKSRYLDFLSLLTGKPIDLDQENRLRCSERLEERKRDVLSRLIERHKAILDSEHEG